MDARRLWKCALPESRRTETSRIDLQGRLSVGMWRIEEVEIKRKICCSAMSECEHKKPSSFGSFNKYGIVYRIVTDVKPLPRLCSFGKSFEEPGEGMIKAFEIAFECHVVA